LEWPIAVETAILLLKRPVAVEKASFAVEKAYLLLKSPFCW